MQNPYYRAPGTSHTPAVLYELPPVQTVTSPGHFQQQHQHHQQQQQQQQQQQNPATLLSAPPSRPDSGLKMAHLLQPLPQPVSNPPPNAVSSYSRYRDSGSGSPDGASMMPDAASNGSISRTPSLISQSGSNLVNAQQQTPLQQKRAYRQRRKDPSCDACRERKCDASESTSCSECTNRKVRCQFTKETNRRMSSIKQVQDLERQLLSTKQQLQQLRSGMAKSDTWLDVDIDGAGQALPKLPDIGYRPPRRPKPPIAQDLSEVRSNLREYGRGIWKVPAPYRQQGPRSRIADSPQLPPKNAADHLLAQYFSCIHSVFPVIHWPSFMAEYEEVYRSGSLVGVPREWGAVLFGVLACGSIHTLEANREESGKEYVKISCGIIDVWQDHFNLDQARVALLASIFLYEINSKSASWVWIGSAVRVAQEIGLHIDSGPWSAVEGEMRRRVWWGLYAWDRLLALEMGKPVLINDQDCDVDLPCPVDEQYLSEGCIPDGQQTTPLLATIHVVRAMGQLTRTLKSHTIGPATLETFERHFTACLATFPSQYHPKSDQYLDPRSLAPIIYLQNARFILHRHNMSPSSAREARSSAMDYCMATALDTAQLLSRCMRNQSGSYDWRPLFASSAGTLLCTHIWRCALLLLFRQEFSAALVCVQASATIGDLRRMNIACGRYVAFFLKCLINRLQRGPVTDLERDEEMMAYVSGDMQGTIDGSWVWQGSETGTELEAMSAPSSTKPSSHPNMPGWSANDSNMDWEGWDWIERTVQYLLSETQKQQQQQQQSAYDMHFQRKPADSMIISDAPPSDEAARQANSHSRMTIASII